MRLFWAILLLFVGGLNVGCNTPDVGATVYTCMDNSECRTGLVCHPVRKRCEPPPTFVDGGPTGDCRMAANACAAGFSVDNTKRLGRVSLKISQVTPVFLTRVRMVYEMGRKQTSTAAEASALHAERIKAVRPRPIVRAGSAEMVCVPRQHAKTAFSMAARPVQTVAAYARVAGQDPDAIPAMIARAVSAKMGPVGAGL